MKRILTYHISTTNPATHIRDFLKSHGYSRALITHLKNTTRGIVKNGVWSLPSAPLGPGDTLTITILESGNSGNILPVYRPLDIIFEDEDLMIVNKPANMPIHPSQGHYENTLANAAAGYFAQQQKSFTFRCINRLDRDTTGLLIIAKHMYSAALLSQMTAKKKIDREYLALVKGKAPVSGIVEAPIGRVEGSTIERQVDLKKGDFARTSYVRLSFFNNLSLLSVRPETGRTHQIRVHMKHIGYPIPGDFLYCADYSHIGRQALHSHCLHFHHPITGKELTFLAPLPTDMCHAIRGNNLPR